MIGNGVRGLTELLCPLLKIALGIITTQLQQITYVNTEVQVNLATLDIASLLITQAVKDKAFKH